MVDDDTHAGDTDNLSFEHVLHLAGGGFAVEADNVVLDEYRDIFGSLEFALGPELFNAGVDGVQEGVFGDEEVSDVNDAGHLQEVFLKRLLLGLQLDLSVESQHDALALDLYFDGVCAPGGATHGDGAISYILRILQQYRRQDSWLPGSGGLRVGGWQFRRFCCACA